MNGYCCSLLSQSDDKELAKLQTLAVLVSEKLEADGERNTVLGS